MGNNQKGKGDVSRTVMPVGRGKKRAMELRVEYKSYTKISRNEKNWFHHGIEIKR